MKKYDTIFLDRDGTLNPDPGYISSIQDFKFFDFTLTALKELKDICKRFCIISNQSGIGRGLIDIKDLSEIHSYILNFFHENSLNLVGIYFCPDHPSNPSKNRKPGTGMFDQASKDHGISLQESLMIGDNVCDIEAAIGCKMDSVLVLTGKGKAASKNSNISPMFIEKNLLTASYTLRKMK
tara:strand:+ start:2449 stop:2991 length:543 start_codon:yes stop_codon:yes gene_type:complete